MSNLEQTTQLPVGSTNTVLLDSDTTEFQTLREMEKTHILAALDLANGNKAKAASLLGVSIKTVYNKLNSFSSQPFSDSSL